MSKVKSLSSYNTLCQRCDNACKQPANVKLIKCPRFIAAPQQLEIPLFKKTRTKTKAS
ncbi:MAG: hypothetical protein JXR67_09935 [Bacteroidales bacterium]|nr:hypothetical protein [Bacteroidales bacterium]